jgi:epoxyqueuosine reductase
VVPLDRQSVIDKALELGFHLAGIAAVPEPPDEAEQAAANHLDQWLSQGYQADMGWMANPRRQDIRQIMPQVRSVISVAMNYYTPISIRRNRTMAKFPAMVGGEITIGFCTNG